MKILLTNDDGINAPGLYTLAIWASKLGEVTVCAPKSEQSGKAHSICIHDAFEIKPFRLFPGISAYSVDSTPADCVRYAFKGLGKKYDIVISGINKGYNVGNDILYSGTVGAAFEASFYGVEALALSTSYGSPLYSESVLNDVYGFILRNKLFSYSKIFNVNIPTEVKGIKITRQGTSCYDDFFTGLGNDMYKQEGVKIESEYNNIEYDTDAVHKGFISVTPLTSVRTDKDAYTKLKDMMLL